MEIQNKIGRDIARALLKSVAHLTMSQEPQLALIKATALYKFYQNDADYSYKAGQDLGSVKPDKLKRNRYTSTLIFPIELSILRQFDSISKDEHDNIVAMLKAGDADFVLAEELINQFRNKRVRQKKYGIYC